MEIVLISLLGFLFGWYSGRVSNKKNILKFLSSISVRNHINKLDTKEFESYKKGMFDVIEYIKKGIVTNSYLK